MPGAGTRLQPPVPAVRRPTALCRHIGIGGLLTRYLKREAGNDDGRAFCFARRDWT